MRVSKLYLFLPVLLVAAAASASAAEGSLKRSFRSVKAPQHTVGEYEIVHPIVTYTRKHGNIQYPSKMNVTISTANTTFILLLTKNREFMPDTFSSICVDQDGTEAADLHHYSNCYYRGKVKGHPTWMVTMSTCHGLQGEFGDFKDPQNLFNLEPMNKADPSLTARHHLFLESVYDNQEGHCGMASDEHGPDHSTESATTTARKGKVRRQVAQQRYMEWVLVNDVAQFKSFENLEETVERALAISNAVDLLYRPLGIQIKVSRVITFTNGTRFQRNRSFIHRLFGLFPNLNEFTDYVTSELIPSGVQFDSAMLLTGHDKFSGTLGVANVGTMCDINSATGYSRDGGRSIGAAISITAHELGHIFNMKHDNGRNCSCTAPDGNTCVMQASLNFPPPTIFSSCSIADLHDLYDRGGDRCLFDDFTSDLICGNGIVEANETCDCGPPQFCKDSCCNATTCQLVEGPGRCTSGACCTDQCTVKSYGSECRASEGDCDVAEFCSGESSECPADVYRPNGISCESDTGYCWNGECPTHENQCNNLFYESGAGLQPCFELNTRGDVYGYCKQQTLSSFSPCDENNILCGKLQCQDGFYKFNQGRSVNTTIFVLPEGTCRSVRLDEEPSRPEDLNVGVVLNGTKCGDGRVCAARECVPLSAPASCPRGDNGQECSGPTNGVCNNGQECSCQVGFIGAACETIHPDYVNECLVDNGGCAHTCTDIIGSFECSCDPGYTLASDNLNCEDVDECDVDEPPCYQICTNQVGSFECSCNLGFYLDSNGRACRDVDECVVDNGGCSHLCNNEYGSFQCSCPDGFIVTSDNHTCKDVDECSVNNGGCDQTCANEVGSFQCSCRSGFTLDADSRCHDIDECVTDNGGCDQRCTNQHGSYECSCNAGYILDSNNQTCTDVNECLVDNGGCAHTCTNIIGSFECSCDPGYSLDSDNLNCEDVDECNDAETCSHICTNQVGSFQCSCIPGFYLDNNGRTCQDVDECLVDNGGCPELCINEIGSFRCACPLGYTLASDNLNCEDVDECIDAETCSHICTNQVGSFQCSCNPGFYLDSKGRTCKDVDECLVDNGGCPERCINEIGSFRCACHIGYTFTSDNLTCEDVNECDVNNGGCGGTCTNEVGSFQCSCGSGFTLDTDGRTCNDIDECVTDNGGCDQRCTNQHGSYECSCNSGYVLKSDNKTCTDVDECASRNGGCDQTCTNTVGSFQCSCADGFTLDNNGRRCFRGPCGRAGYEPGCCTSFSCHAGNCYCDKSCHRYGDCCSDVPPLSELTC